jgi:hypothetical protein
MFDVSDLRPTIIPKSDQLNSEQLLGAPITITVTDVRVGSSDEQPISVHYEGENGRPFKPCKTMRKVLIFAWGPDGREWIGRSMSLYNDPQVRFGGAEVGGIRISHMTDIDRDVQVSLTATKGKKALHTIKRMERQASGPTLAHVLQLITTAANSADMKAAKAAAETLRAPEDISAALAAYRARVAALKTQAAPSPLLSEYLRKLAEATDAEPAGLLLDEARDVLPTDAFKKLAEAFDAQFSA